MEEKKHKNILMVNGVLHGHFTGNVEIVRELVSLGHNVTCYVLDEFADRLKDIGAKLVVYSIDKSDFNKLPPHIPPNAINSFIFIRSFEALFTLLPKDENKYDYYIFDSFFDVKEMNKIFKLSISNYILICTAFIFTDVDFSEDIRRRSRVIKPINVKYNLNLEDYVNIHYIPNKFKKLILTSKYFHLRSENTDDTCFFIGPCVEKRKIDENFKFEKDKNKKLIFISLGTLFYKNYDLYLKCIEAFKNSEEYQIIMSVGKSIDTQKLGDIPKNFSVFTYVPQLQLLPDVDVFITHGGLNSTQEALLCGLPLIVVPQINDQFDNGKRIEELGAGILLDKNKLDVDVLKNAVNDIICNKEKYKKGIDKIAESLKEAKNNRKNVYEKIFI